MLQLYSILIYSFKGYTPFIIITKYWLFSLYFTVYINPLPLYCRSPLQSELSPLVITSLFSISVNLLVLLYSLGFFIFPFFVFFRFHKQAISYSICLSLSDSFHLEGIMPSQTTQLQMTKFHSFLCLSSIPLEKAMAPHSSTLAWKIPWREEPARLQSMGSLRVGHD